LLEVHQRFDRVTSTGALIEGGYSARSLSNEKRPSRTYGPAASDFSCLRLETAAGELFARYQERNQITTGGTDSQ